MPILTPAWRLKVAGLALLLIPMGAIFGWNAYTGWFRGYQAHLTYSNAGAFFFVDVAFQTVLFLGALLTILLFFYAALFGHAPHFLLRFVPTKTPAAAGSDARTSFDERACDALGEQTFALDRQASNSFLFAASAFAAIAGFIVILICCEMAANRNIHGIIGVLVCVYFLVILFWSAEPLARFRFAGGPALTVSEQGVRYRILSEDFVPWSQVSRATFWSYGGRNMGLKLELTHDFAKAARWRGTLPNFWRPKRFTVRFKLIDAPNARIVETFRRIPIVARS